MSCLVSFSRILVDLSRLVKVSSLSEQQHAREAEEKQGRLNCQILDWRAPEAIPESLDAKINSDAPATEQLDELEGWLDRQKDHDAGDWPTGEFTGGKHDRHDSADDPKA